MFLLVGLTLGVVTVAALDQLGSIGGRLILVTLGLAHLVRMASWYSRRIWQDGLIWTLHVSYAAIPLTALIMASTGPTSSLGHNSQHILAIQGISLMILSMMSRVSLGHTGRPIKAPFWLGAASILMMVSVLARGLVPAFWPALSLAGFSVAIWTAALAMIGFSIHYAPILNQPRADNKPG